MPWSNCRWYWSRWEGCPSSKIDLKAIKLISLMIITLFIIYLVLMPREQTNFLPLSSSSRLIKHLMKFHGFIGQRLMKKGGNSDFSGWYISKLVVMKSFKWEILIKYFSFFSLYFFFLLFSFLLFDEKNFSTLTSLSVEEKHFIPFGKFH